MKEKIRLLWQDRRLMLVLLALLCALSFLPEDTGMTQEEERISKALSQVSGAGRVQVTIYYSEQASGFGSKRECTGAVAVSEGAGEIAVRLQIAQALETLLGLRPQDVMVLEMEERE